MARITDAMVDRAYQELRGTCGGNKNDYFGLLYLQQEHGLSLDAARDQVAFGGNDYGVDGFHFDLEKSTLYLYQFKFSDNHSLFKDSLKRLISDGMERVFRSPHADAKLNDMLQLLASRLFENRSVINQVIFRFVFTGDPKEAERSLVLDKLREDLENKRYLIHEFFAPRNVLFAVEFRSAAGKVGMVGGGAESCTFKLDLGSVLSHAGANGEQMMLGFIRLVDLHRIYKRMGPRFFERNIRFGYGTDKYVNRALLRAFRRIVIEQKDAPSVFAFDHNGITLYAEEVDTDDGETTIASPRLLNGAQTVTTFAEFLAKNEDDPAMRDGKERIEQLRVICKIITNASSEFVTRVTVNNNRQNPVAPWNLHANDEIQLELHEKFRELGIFYERQERAFESMDWNELNTEGYTEVKAIQLLKLAQTFLVSDGLLDRLSNMQEVFEEDRLYDQVFSKFRLRADTRHIVLCYKIQLRLNKVLWEIREKGYDRYAFIGKARHLIWALLWHGLASETDLDEFAEQFGKNMTLPAEFTAKLVQIGTTRCRPLVSELIALPEYAERVKKEQYGFLRSQTAFKFCMEKARKRWRWSEQWLR